MSEKSLFLATVDWPPLKKAVCCAGVIFWLRNNLLAFLPFDLLQAQKSSAIWNRLKQQRIYSSRSLIPSARMIYDYFQELVVEGFFEKVEEPRQHGRGSSQKIRPTANALQMALELKVVDEFDVAKTRVFSTIPPHKRATRSSTLIHRILRSEAIRPSSEVQEFLSSQKREYLAIDDAILLHHAPGFSGLGLEDIEFKYDRNAKPLELRGQDLSYIQSTYGQLNQWEKNKQNYFLCGFRPAIIDQGNRWKVTLGPSNYSINRAIERALDNQIDFDQTRTTLRSLYGDGRLGFDEDLNNMVIVYLLVVSELDEQVIFLQRSKYVSYYPLHWYATIAEQMIRPDDKSFFDTAIRGLKEEIGIANASTSWIRMLGVVRAYSNFNTVICGIARLPYFAEDLEQNWIAAGDKEEAVAFDFYPFQLASMIRILSGETYEPFRKNNQPYRIHPLAKMNILLALFRKFGYNQVISEIKRASFGTS